jgi:hypothetical protein
MRDRPTTRQRAAPETPPTASVTTPRPAARKTPRARLSVRTASGCAEARRHRAATARSVCRRGTGAVRTLQEEVTVGARKAALTMGGRQTAEAGRTAGTTEATETRVVGATAAAEPVLRPACPRSSAVRSRRMFPRPGPSGSARRRSKANARSCLESSASQRLGELCRRDVAQLDPALFAAGVESNQALRAAGLLDRARVALTVRPSDQDAFAVRERRHAPIRSRTAARRPAGTCVGRPRVSASGWGGWHRACRLREGASHAGFFCWGWRRGRRLRSDSRRIRHGREWHRLATSARPGSTRVPGGHRRRRFRGGLLRFLPSARPGGLRRGRLAIERHLSCRRHRRGRR